MDLIVRGEPEEIAELIFCLQRLSFEDSARHRPDEDSARHQAEPSKPLEQKRIESLRKARNLTQADLAKKIGVDQTAVHLWETGKTFPRLHHLKQLAKELDCSLDELVASPQKNES